MTKHKIAGFGHSHMAGIFQAYGRGRKQGDFDALDAFFARLNTESFQPNFEMLNSAAPGAAGKNASRKSRLAARAKTLAADAPQRVRMITEALERRLGHILRREDPDAVLLAVMGNEYHAQSLLRSDPPYDFEFPGWDIPVVEGVDLVPFDEMKSRMQQLAEQNALLFWRFFDGETDKPIYLLPPPPPISSELHILSYPGSFGERAKKQGISPLGFRRKMWMLYCLVLRETVAGTNTRFVDLPDVVFVDGCLAKQFWQEDPSHGNADYGRVVLDHVLQLAFGSE